jgi:hypothetical protein
MKTTTILATVILLATTMLAQAGVIFADDFNRPPSNIVGNGWVETEFGSSDARIISNSGSILGAVQSENAAVAQQVSTLGLFSTMLEFDYAAVLVGGTLSALLSLDNTVYTTLWTSPQLSSGSLYVPQADNQANIWIRFQTSGINGAAQIDNVMTTVPEPATLGLTLGLLGLGGMTRRRRHRATGQS